ncbi:MAG TPA: hypothetical protein VNI36_00690 [Candidatus Dormibacteraeota bacterium]|nr:hypothetical protein [Candidatus Dormibacteraeota bacterium]
MFWNSVYTLKLRTLDLRKNTKAENAVLFDEISDAAPASLSPPETMDCEGSIESVHASRPSPQITTVENAQSVSGWMGVWARDGQVPDSVYVLLTGGSGKKIYVRAHSTRRDDIKLHFHQSGMRDPGYAALVDVSGLQGKFTLSLARVYKGNLSVCRQFHLPLLINLQP